MDDRFIENESVAEKTPRVTDAPSEKPHKAVKARLVAGLALNLLLLYWIFNIAGKTYGSTEYHYILIDLTRNAVSCILPLLAIPLLIPVIRVVKGRQRLLACALLVIPIAFGCVACFTFIPEFLGDLRRLKAQ